MARGLAAVGWVMIAVGGCVAGDPGTLIEVERVTTLKTGGMSIGPDSGWVQTEVGATGRQPLLRLCHAKLDDIEF